MIKFWIFATVRGDACVIASEKGIKGALLPGWTRQKLIDYVIDHYSDAVPAKTDTGGEAQAAIKFIQDYFKGMIPKKRPRLDFSGLTGFQREVLKAVNKIGYGETRSYSWVAHRIGRSRAVRAAAHAVAQNPLPLFIPCHRVIGKDGSLRGFSGVGGIHTKKAMLALESKIMAKSRS